ncbi:glycosyltransferase [Hymenobacter artigasi]|uniref:Glycosyltransferase involved in cell wall biosynthesis n=1 Tax=Hymenobacter artigasi TaxID=2719616 RepID=A0ABX1HC80_9BACT|nr:glycosyltransferase [Hymenobacter artigasi]NKI87844.1 glycosyltransferase involved in cell wall biosynthesis [Hymenobacter artigasi]
MKSPRVLHLPKWYPNRYDDQDGDFVARHVAAIAAHGGVEVAVLFAAVARGPLPGLIAADEDFSGAWPTLRYYYRAVPTGLGLVDKPLKLLLYFWCLLRGYRRLRQHWGGQRPDLVHVHVLLRTGLFAWALRAVRGIPFIVTEHWTLYLPARAGGISGLRRVLTRAVVRQAAALHTVSDGLRRAMAALGFVNPRSVVIANVVDTGLFHPNPPTHQSTNPPIYQATLLHVSAFHDQVKNISGVLRVVARLRTASPGLQLRIAGYGPDEQALHAYATELDLLADGTVTFLGKLPHEAVAAEMARATALVSFSRAETFGCVLLEARASGCPVVATRTGGVPELFQPENAFGLLVNPDDEAALENAIKQVIDNGICFDPMQLRADATARCAPAAVGRAFGELYQKVLNE